MRNACLSIIGADMNEEITEGRFVRLETKVGHMERDLGEMKEPMKNIEQSLVRLTMIAEQNQQLEPKIDSKADKEVVDKIANQQAKNTRQLTLAIGALAAITFVLRFFDIQL